MTIIAGPICIPYNSPQQKALASAENRTSVCGIKIDSYSIRLNHKSNKKKDWMRDASNPGSEQTVLFSVRLNAPS